MRGRNPAGPEFVEKLAGSDKAKLRARVLLEVLAGTCRVPEACERLGIKPARLDQIRIDGLQAMVTELDDKPVGRPARQPSPAEVENEQLHADVVRLTAERDAALIKAELGVALPRVGAASKKNDSEALAPSASTEVSEAPAPTPSAPTEATPTLSLPTEQNIVMNIQKLLTAEPILEGPPRRGLAGQLPRRETEQAARQHVVVISQRLVEQGWTWSAASELLGVPERTLRHWRFGPATQLFNAAPLGRPAHVATAPERNQVIRFIHEQGPAIGVPSLGPEFPLLPRVELESILTRYRHVWRRRHREQLKELHWSMPGSAWAIDHHGPRAAAIDGCFSYLLAVRDLASGQVLLWLPVADAAAHSAIEALETLFLVHGAPLVLKSDNGSAFIAAELRKLCRRFGVKNLYSPPRKPSYNGSIEATIGSLKIRTERYAAQDGRPGSWTTADCDRARHDANTTARPHGEHGPSPDQVWATRPMIAQARRDAFREAAARRFDSLAAAQAEPQDHARHRAMDRNAISQVLVELGYLSITRGRSRLPVISKKMATMS